MFCVTECEGLGQGDDRIRVGFRVRCTVRRFNECVCVCLTELEDPAPIPD